MNGKTIVGLVALTSTVIYLMLEKKKSAQSLDGVEVKINPQKLVDGALAMSNIHPMAKDGIRSIAANAMKKYYGLE